MLLALDEQEEKKRKQQKNNMKDTTTTEGTTRATTEDISVSLGDTGVVVTNSNTRSANGAFTIYLPSTNPGQHLCK